VTIDVTRLPAKRTFLVRLSDETDPEKGLCCGRVEHLQSGQTMLFQSEGSLKEFFITILMDQIRHKQSEQISKEP
jgi:hypothetical protein